VFVTASDAAGLRACRAARVLAATPRVRLPVLQEAAVRLDALIGSGLDPAEAVPDGALELTPRLPGAMVDAYGCGDSFAAGVTAALAAGWSTEQAISLGCHCGAACATWLGPYPAAA
jgi:ribokinase